MADGSRTERDTMGDVQVPAWALWGASTQRALDNFPVSGIRFPHPFIKALARAKGSAAAVNTELACLDARLGDLIQKACRRIETGEMDEHFPLDIFQTGSGTSTNTNANEVIANLANEAAGSSRGTKSPVHPNDHVNMSQSSNDVIPTCIHLAALDGIHSQLLPSLGDLQQALSAKASAFESIVKPGRTHLMDATPVTLGQEFGGYARQVELGIARIEGVLDRLGEVALGGTAVGTGLNAPGEFAGLVIRRLATIYGFDLTEAQDHFEAQGAQDSCVELSGALKTVAVSLNKIANDLRWMNSGPNTGLGEIRLPDLQPGSSIMPGKVNPVACEVVTQVAAQVIGADAVITFGGASGAFELNVMLPVIAHNLIGAITILSAGARLLAIRGINGLEADAEHCRDLVESTDILATALNPHIGYDKAAEIVKEARRTKRRVREIAAESSGLDPAALDRILDIEAMTRRPQ